MQMFVVSLDFLFPVSQDEDLNASENNVTQVKSRHSFVFDQSVLQQDLSIVVMQPASELFCL